MKKFYERIPSNSYGFLHFTCVRGNLLYYLYLILYHCFRLHSPTETLTAVLSTQAPIEAVSRQRLTYAVITQVPTDFSATTETPTSLSGIGKLDLSFVVVFLLRGGGGHFPKQFWGEHFIFQNEI